MIRLAGNFYAEMDDDCFGWWRSPYGDWFLTAFWVCVFYENPDKPESYFSGN